MALALEVSPDAEAAAERGAAYIAERAAATVSERGRFAFAVSGGKTPWTMLAALDGRMPWERATIFQVDERIVPEDDPDRNLMQLLRSLPAGGAANVRPMPVWLDDPEEGARLYAASLPDRLDLVHLGLGADGHTASLVPSDPVLEVADRDVAVTAPYQGRRRMTLTFPALNRARSVLWLVTGADKAEALRRLRAGDATIPAGRVSVADGLIIADEAAAG